MEDRESIFCYDNTEDKCPIKKNCLGIVETILLTLFSFVVGLIIGAIFTEVIILALPAVIVLAITLGLSLLLTFIFIVCDKKKVRK